MEMKLNTRQKPLKSTEDNWKNNRKENLPQPRDKNNRKPKAETIIPTVKKYASSSQILLVASEKYVDLLAMKWGMGETK